MNVARAIAAATAFGRDAAPGAAAAAAGAKTAKTLDPILASAPQVASAARQGAAQGAALAHLRSQVSLAAVAAADG